MPTGVDDSYREEVVGKRSIGMRRRVMIHTAVRDGYPKHGSEEEEQEENHDACTKRELPSSHVWAVVPALFTASAGIASRSFWAFTPTPATRAQMTVRLS